MIQKKADQYYNMISTLEDQLHTLYSVEATNNMVKILKEVNLTKDQVQSNLDEVEQTFEKIAEQKDQERAIEDFLKENLNSDYDEDIEKELEKLELEEAENDF